VGIIYIDLDTFGKKKKKTKKVFPVEEEEPSLCIKLNIEDGNEI